VSPDHSEIEQYKRILDTLPDMVSFFDSNLECIYVNQTFVNELNIPRDEVLGESIGTVLVYLSDDQAQEWIETMERLASGAQPQARDKMTVETDEGDIHIEVTASRIESTTGDLIGIVNVIRDVTERVDTQRELHRQNERLEEFASLISHDIRSPLNVAEARLELAQLECESEHLPPIEQAIGRINRITEDVLWLAREGRDIGSTDAVMIRDVGDAAWSIVADGIEQAKLHYAGDEISAATIEADDDRLHQLLENLFRNAIEHGGEDVTVEIGTVTDGFYIEDDGPGISRDNRDDVFTSGYSTSDEGTGFGLYIVKQIAEGHGWNIRVTNGADGGARFEITDVEFVTG
jgi:PAS domain S-box-containing protein